jgi:hypothetical protein
MDDRRVTRARDPDPPADRSLQVVRTVLLAIGAALVATAALVLVAAATNTLLSGFSAAVVVAIVVLFAPGAALLAGALALGIAARRAA